MQKNRANRVKTKIGAPHRLDRMARPYEIWLYVLAVIPMIVMFVLMFVDTEGIKLDGMTFVAFENMATLAEQSTLVAFFNSVKYSVLTTLICIFFGYLIAYTLYKSKIKNKYLILLLLVLPMWTNILLRINALAGIFKAENIVVSFLNQTIGAMTGNPQYDDIKGVNIIGLNVLDFPLLIGIDIEAIFGSDFYTFCGVDVAVILGMVFTYLPFIVMPIYTSLEKIDPLLSEAALDLGSTDFVKFWKVIFPISSKGIVSGSIMVLLPCLSGFAIPKILGAGNIMLIGNIIEQNFINMSYSVGSVLAVVILVVILGSIIIVNKFDKEGETLI